VWDLILHQSIVCYVNKRTSQKTKIPFPPFIVSFLNSKNNINGKISYVHFQIQHTVSHYIVDLASTFPWCVKNRSGEERIRDDKVDDYVDDKGKWMYAKQECIFSSNFNHLQSSLLLRRRKIITMCEWECVCVCKQNQIFHMCM
jgi:hypothetical protein